MRGASLADQGWPRKRRARVRGPGLGLQGRLWRFGAVLEKLENAFRASNGARDCPKSTLAGLGIRGGKGGVRDRK